MREIEYKAVFDSKHGNLTRFYDEFENEEVPARIKEVKERAKVLDEKLKFLSLEGCYKRQGEGNWEKI